MRTRNSKIKVELLNFNFQTINYLEGNAIGGNITVDANSDIRRSCSIDLVVNRQSLSVAEDSEIWLERYVKIYQGIDNPRTKQTVWWNMGIFLINNPNRTYDISTNTLSFEGLDLMSKLTGARNGQLPAMATLVPAGSNVADVVRDTITQLGGFSKYIIQDVGYTVPYDIKMDTGATIYELLVKIRDLYSDWEMFFDVDGVFHFQQITDGINEPVVVNFNQLNQQLVTSETVNIDFENVKNNIIVYGRLLDDGTQVMATASDNITDSPFSISKIGQINYIVSDEQIYSNELAQDRANYELFMHARMNDTITLNTVPIPWLNDVNVKIAYTNIEDNIEGQFLIKSLNIPLDVGSALQITANKVYSNPTYNVSVEPNMQKWQYNLSDAFGVSYDISSFINDVKVNTQSEWEIVYIPITTIQGKEYTFSFDCTVITPYKPLAGYYGIAYQALTKVDNSDNINNSLITNYILTGASSQSYSFNFVATTTTTYLAFNFGYADDYQNIEVKIGNFSLYYEV
nr:MAG TPA: tail protein [Caudoviricetes sp.]